MQRTRLQTGPLVRFAPSGCSEAERQAELGKEESQREKELKRRAELNRQAELFPIVVKPKIYI